MCESIEVIFAKNKSLLSVRTKFDILPITCSITGVVLGVVQYYMQCSLTVCTVIQVYMGDRKGKQSPGSVALDVIARGWSCVSLRDEIYVQLAKQTTDNRRQ